MIKIQNLDYVIQNIRNLIPIYFLNIFFPLYHSCILNLNLMHPSLKPNGISHHTSNMPSILHLFKLSTFAGMFFLYHL